MMVIISVDTSDKHGSVALCRGDSRAFEVLGLTTIATGTYSNRLIPEIGDLLNQAQLSKTDIEGFVVVHGPGSFTGLRVGLATVKGLCEILGKPVAVVSMLEAFALTYAVDGETISVVLDARRGEIYLGNYTVREHRVEANWQGILRLEECLKRLSDLRSRVITTFPTLVGLNSPATALVEPLRADAIARLGLRKLLAGETADAAALDANYIRRSNAELFASPSR